MSFFTFTSRPGEMSSSEFQAFYDCGYMPERFWPEEIERLRNEYAEGKITLSELDDSLDDMMRPPEQRLRGLSGA